MGKTDTSENKPAKTDPSLEFDVFETARVRLVEVFTKGGHNPLRAERVALYVVEGLRRVPKLLNVLTRIKAPAQDEILDALGPVLDEAPALEKAKRMLLRVDEGSEHEQEREQRELGKGQA